MAEDLPAHPAAATETTDPANDPPRPWAAPHTPQSPRPPPASRAATSSRRGR
jgi:hypothetical protein